MNIKVKCQCGHKRDVHGETGWKGDKYDGECCVIYRGPNGNLKSCSCNAFSESNGGSGPRKKITGTSQQVDTETVSHGEGCNAMQKLQPRADRIQAPSVDNHTSKVNNTNEVKDGLD